MKVFKAAVLAVGTLLVSSAAFAGTPPVVPYQSVTMCGALAVDASIAYRNVDATTADITASAFTRGLGVNPGSPQNVTLSVATADRNNKTGEWRAVTSASTAFGMHASNVSSVSTTPRAAACGLRTKIVAQMRCPNGTLDTKVIEHSWTSCAY